MRTTRTLLIASCARAALAAAAALPAAGQSSLTAWWTFDSDYTSSVNNTVYNGSAVGAGTAITNTAGQFVNGSGGLAIDDSLATANFVSVGTNPIADLDASITVSAWYQLNDIGGDGMDDRNFVWETAPSTYPLSFATRTSGGQKHAQWFTQSPSLSSSASAGPVIQPGTWHHAAVVINQDAGSLQYYHNGSLIDNEALPSGYSIADSVSGFNIGNHRAGDGSRNWDGYIDDVAVFQGALSQTQVTSLFNGSDTPLSLVNGAVTAPPPPAPDPLAFVPGSWTMVVIPDTQNYSTHHPEIFTEVTQWIADNRDDRNIGLTLHVGDITNRNNTTEWDRAAESVSRLDGAVPYILATGNHDVGPGGGAGDRSTLFNDYFDESIYSDVQGNLVYENLEIVEQFEDVSRFGTGPDNQTLENTAYEFTAPDGREMLIFSLEWGVRQEVVDWANTVAAQAEYEDHTAILLTHAYMFRDNERYDWTNQNTANDGPDGITHSGSAQAANPHVYGTADTDDGDPSNDTNDGEELWRELVSQHDNFELTFNGHVLVGGQLGFRQDAGLDGQTVHQMLFNAQGDANGGDGWIRLLEFLPDGETVQVKTYSPYRDRLGLDPWRTDAQNQFVISLTGIDSLIGDLNRDGFVGAEDLDILLANWGDSTAFFDVTLGDASGDGLVGQEDLDLVLANWGHGNPPDTNIPEPSSLSALALLGFGLGRQRRQRICRVY